MKKWIAALLCVILLMPAAMAEKYTSMPYWQQIIQHEGMREYLRDEVYVRCTYPDTRNEQINREMGQLIDAMAEKGKSFLPEGHPKLMPAYLDVGSTVFHTGDRWMSFLTIARIAAEREQIYLDFDARVYNIETGSRIYLSDLFAPDSPAWGILSLAVEEQLIAYFSNEIPDEQTLALLCTRETLENTPFTLTPAKLSLHFRADQLYPGKHTMMHVNLYYPQIREYMTGAGQMVTDNSNYKLIALTYDDGGARGSSMNVIDQLRKYGANATFFIIGNKIYMNHDVISREHDAGYAVQSHNYEHVYNGITPEKVQYWKRKFDQALDSVIGQQAIYMRAPGGNYKGFVKGNVGLPLIHWSAISGDATSEEINAYSIALQVIASAKDGGVVLLHDLNPLANQYSAIFLEELVKRGYLFVTVDELFSHYGVVLEPNILYYSCEDIAEQQ